MKAHPRFLPLWWLLCLPASVVAAQSPTPPGATPTVVCTDASDFSTVQLYGEWQLILWPDHGSAAQPASRGVIRFERHPEYGGSVRGTVRRNAPSTESEALVSGDVVSGAFNLDESADGVTMDAVWEGAPADCGRAIRGQRRPAEGRPATEPAMNFLLRKASGWN